MEWLTENWFWVLIGFVFIAMHLFGHGGHGGHGSHDGHGGHTGHGKQDDFDDEDKQRKNQIPDDSRHGHH
jgi:hypothetical protein